MQIFSSEIFERLENINKDYLRLCDLLAYEEVILDKKLCIKLQKEKQIYEPLATKYQSIQKLISDLKDLKQTQPTLSDGEKQLYQQEIQNIQNQIKAEKTNILKLLSNLNAQMQNVELEIVQKSGELSNDLFVDLANGYKNFFQKNNFDFKVFQNQNSIIFNITGLNAKQLLKNEMGLHNANCGLKQGSCAVFVCDSFNLAEPTFNDEDIKIQVCRSSGAGGQHINTTDSAIKVTHLKTGISCVCQDQRSQFQNKQTALQNLKVKVLQNYNKQKNTHKEQQKKDQVKLVKQNYVAKIYDYNINKIKSKTTDKEILLNDFLLGNDL